MEEDYLEKLFGLALASAVAGLCVAAVKKTKQNSRLLHWNCRLFLPNRTTAKKPFWL